MTGGLTLNLLCLRWRAIVLLVTMWAGGVHAHESRPAYLEIKQVAADNYEMLWKVPARGPSRRLGLSVHLPEGSKFLVPPSPTYVGGAFIERSTISRPGGLADAKITIDGLSMTLTDVLVRIERLDGSTQVTRVKPAKPFFFVEAAPTMLGVAGTYLVLGIDHIWGGIDHLLFVACLVVIAGTWRRILITITGFTIAHSMTLGLAALGWVRVPVPPVEAVIALTIVYLAREMARDRCDTLTWRYPIVVSVAFGLLHGFGFASALGEIGLPSTEIPAALLSFNLGVEVGQIIFVMVLLALLWGAWRLTRKTDSPKEFSPRYLSRIQTPAAYAIGSLASFWMIQRVADFQV